MDSLPRLRADAKQSYDQLVKAADIIFSSQGSAATLQAIAKKAGVGIGTLYRHFPDRKSLLEVVYVDKLNNLINKAFDALGSKRPDQALEDWLKMIIDYSAAYGGFRDLMLLEVRDKDSQLISAGSALLSKAQNSGLTRSDITTDDLLQLISAITTTAADQDSKRSDTLLSIMIAGLKPSNQ